MTTYSMRALSLVGVSALATLIGCPAAFAQEDNSGGAQLEEVVVTAERREASLQDTPISITALSQESLDAKQVLDVQAIAKVAPGMAAKPTLSPLEITIAIRGVTLLIPSINVDPAIGTYTDGVYNVLNAGSNSSLIDLERVEVLKGPQGTLFGRNTIGGAISITTAKPTDDFGGYVSVAAGNYDAQTYTGVINAPIKPGVVDTRLVFQHTEHDGYGKNFTTNTPTSSLDQDYFRASVRVTPADGWEILGTSAYTKAKGYSAATKLLLFDPAFSIAPGVLPPLNVLLPALSGRPGDLMTNYVNRGDIHDTYSNLPQEFGLTQQQYTGTITGQLTDSISVKSITGYIKTTYNQASDLDGSPYELLDLIAYPIHAKQFSEEFQVYGDAFDNRLKWIGGLYYYRETGDQSSNVVALGPLSNTFNSESYEVKNTSVSAFAQVTYEIVDNLRLTGGIRHVTDKRRVTYFDHIEAGRSQPGPFVACTLANAPTATTPEACSFTDRVKYKYVPWTVGLDYKPKDDLLLYAKVSKGFRSGAYGISGPNATAPINGVTPAQAAAANARELAAFGPVAPERLLSYEAGAKAEFMDRRVRINGAVYYSEYDNIQLTQNLPGDPNCPTCNPPAVLANSGTAEIYGGELEVTALIGGFELGAGLGYTHPKYVEGPQVGTPIINVSKWNYTIGGAYPIDTSLGTLTLNASYSYRSKAVYYPVSPGLPAEAAAALTQKGYGTIDARASFELESAPVTISVYGQNLADKEYLTSATNFPLGFVAGWAGAPRTYGIELKYTY